MAYYKVTSGLLLTLTVAISFAPVAALAVQAVLATSSAVAEDDSNTLSEIVVTAQKRAQNIQDVPMAVTAVTGRTLLELGVNDVSALAQLVPNITFNDSQGQTRIGIRGITFDNVIATGAESRVAYFLDGVYVSPSGNIPGTLFDVDRIEALRGPQGTLFGRNAIAGAVNNITRDPTETYDGYLQSNFGNYDSSITEGAFGGPIADGVSFRVAARTSDHDGYGQNLTNGEQIDNLHQRDYRAKLKIQPNEALTVSLSADYSLRNDNNGVYFGGFEFPTGSLPGNPLVSQPGNLRNTYADTTTKEFMEYSGFGATVNWRFGDGLALTSITGYRSAHEAVTNDYDFSNARLLSPANEGDAYQDLSEELRLQQDFSRGHIMGGLYYFDEWYQSAGAPPINLILFGGPNFLSQGLAFGGEQRTRALGVFSQGTIDLTNALHLTLGVRYSSDRKRLYDEFDSLLLGIPYNPATACRQPCNSSTIATLPPGSIARAVSTTWDNVSPLATLQYDLDESRNVYLTYAKGFKSGGYDIGQAPLGVPYNPETLNDYELGFKGYFFNHHLRTNIAAFYYDYTNLQVSQDLSSSIGLEILNAAGARLYGLEWETDAVPVEHLKVDFAGSVEHSWFTNFSSLDPSRPDGPNGNDPNTPFNLAGNQLPSAPTFTARYGIQYTWPTNIGALTLRGEGYSISHVFFDQFNEPSVAASAHTIANAFFMYESKEGRYYASVYGRNLANVFRIAGATVGSGFQGSPVETSFIAPRTFGVTFGIHFGSK